MLSVKGYSTGENEMPSYQPVDWRRLISIHNPCLLQYKLAKIEDPYLTAQMSKTGLERHC